MVSVGDIATSVSESDIELPVAIPPVPGNKAYDITGPGNAGESPGDGGWEYYEAEDDEQLGPSRKLHNDEEDDDENNELYVNHATNNGY